MPRRTGLYVAVAVAAVALGSVLVARRSRQGLTATAGDGGVPVDAGVAEEPPPLPAPLPASEGPALPRPPASIAVFGVWSDRPEPELRALLAGEVLASRVGSALCGDESACGEVRAAIRDERTTRLRLSPATDWQTGRLDVDAAAIGLSAADRAAIARAPRVVVVEVSAPTSSRHLAVRAAVAATAAIAQAVGGFVQDPLLGRIERPAAFARHAVTSALDASAFRADLTEVLDEPVKEGLVRVLTAGLSRWGAPDVEAAPVPSAAKEAVGEILLGAARALADGAQGGALTLSRDDLAQARGRAYPTDAGLPPSVGLAVEIVPSRPEAGDPNDFMVRLEPAGGGGAIAYVDLAERFFGPLSAIAPPPEALAKERSRAQTDLPAALARLAAAGAGAEAGPGTGSGRPGKLLVRLPFPIPGDAGVESMWIEVTRSDAESVTGRLLDEPLGATDVARGDEVTRPRALVEDLRWAR